MRLTILALGRARPGPEKTLTEDYLQRLAPMGRGVGFGPARLLELEARSGRREEESALLLERAPSGAKLVALDERGETPSSLDFARRLGRWRDGGAAEAAFLIGGADGHAEILRERADWVVSLGRLTLPHMLARAVLAEQLYRAASILAGHPYHRE
ncbi:23S rRNA (pseudouridine(1915)-N(3))-methyltransferase RlmH [Neomegalonema sp.]|uniref:23S rRNA (pseudouridine(1915)-N(3))-methyltransferase RlmH n=1 Tax=Neomegalonema sp. TaxID=2039713 RepID=UPI002618B280|nr:23S rRNA (pseudouridine(1915)-N(3))-methyltransferase RlmH [Neomegalonema sp.]MDD2867322.1 23S rRNA (pseudouridine(1915)-N(3))-methyltransferase RlmH [Neomegalonema sp.]